MRATLHSGKGAKKGKVGYSAGHNDRSLTANASNIDQSREDRNLNWSYDGGVDFTVGELKFYEEHFKEYFDEMNRKAVEARHAERVSSLEERYRNKRYCPTEQILQIGDRNNHPTPEQSAAAVTEYIGLLQNRYGSNLTVLNFSIHNDESVTHCHLRYVIAAHDTEGRAYPCVERGLEEMGVELPDPTHTRFMKKGKDGKEVEDTRLNHRNITFTEDIRQIWENTIEEKTGIRIERIPDATRKRGMTKQQLIEYETALAQEKLDATRKELEEAQQILADKEEKKGLFGAKKIETVTIPKSEYQQLLDAQKELPELRERAQKKEILDARERNLDKAERYNSGLLRKIDEIINNALQSAYQRLISPLKRTRDKLMKEIRSLVSIRADRAAENAVTAQQTDLQRRIQENAVDFYKHFQSARFELRQPEYGESMVEEAVKDEIDSNIRNDQIQELQEGMGYHLSL